MHQKYLCLCTPEKNVFYIHALQVGMGGDNRTQNERAYVCQSNDRRMCVGPSSWRQNVSIVNYLQV